MLRNFLKVALRNIIRHKSYSLVNIAGLAIGMACVILIFLWVQNELSYDRFHERANQLHRVAFTTEQQDFHSYYLPGPLAAYLKDNYPEIIDAANYRETGAESKIARGETSFLRKGAFVDPAFLEMFSFPFQRGNSETAFADPLSIVITEKLARAVFGEDDPLGQAIKIDDAVDLKVTGLLRDIPANSHLQFDFLISFALAPPYMKKWDNKAVLTYVQLQEHCPLAEVSAKISEVYNQHNPGATKNYLYLQPVVQTHLYDLGSWSKGEQKAINYVYILSAIAAAILLIACVNFMNLATARAASRAREIGIRKAVGSSRQQLIRQFFSESILLSLLALVLATILVELLLPTVNKILGEQLELFYSGGTLLQLLAVALITGLISGVYPALLLSSFPPAAIMRGGLSPLTSRLGGSRGRTPVGTGRFSLRRILVVGQFAFSIVLIVTVMVLGNQLDYIRDMDLGYDQEEIVVLRLFGGLARQHENIKNELLKNPNIENITRTFSKQLIWSESCGIDWEGKQPGDEFDVGINRVDFDYLQTFKMEMAAGRFYSKQFPADRTDALVINEAAVRAMGMEDPVGQEIGIPALKRKGTIIGVIKDFHSESLHKEVRPFALIPGNWFNYMNIRIKQNNLHQTLGFIEQKVREAVPDDPLSYVFLNKELEEMYRVEQRTGELVSYMTYLAIFISCLGLYGLAAFSIERRTKEIAVRKVHGASAGGLVQLISRDFIMLVGFACAIAWPVAYYVVDRWLQNFAYRTAIGWEVFVLSGILACIVVLFTVGFHAIKAALANPVDSLRHE